MSLHSFTRADRLIEGWLSHFGDSQSERDLARLERLMLSVLPAQWQIKVVSAGISDGVWTLCVNHGSDAHQLRFLSTEIEAKLAEKLPHAPRIKVRVDPELWIVGQATARPPATLHHRRYSDDEAERILRALQSNAFRHVAE